MKRHTVILPLLLPRLTDEAAAQLLAEIPPFVEAIEHFYAEQAHHYHKRQGEIRADRPSTSSRLSDRPF